MQPGDRPSRTSPAELNHRRVRSSSVEFARDSRRRALAALPSLFTLGNMLCGFACILESISGNYVLGAVFIGLSVLLDIADGAVARLVGSVTPFGLQFDSLADLVSFGVAPAVLAFAWSLSDIDPLGWVVCFVWLAAAAIRLARFNVNIDPRADKRYFTGLPSPGAAGVVIATVFTFADGFHGSARLWGLLVVLLPALLMVSSIRYRSFRSLVTPRPGHKPYPLLGVVAVLAAGFATVPAVTGATLALGYLLQPVGSAVVTTLAGAYRSATA